MRQGLTGASQLSNCWVPNSVCFFNNVLSFADLLQPNAAGLHVTLFLNPPSDCTRVTGTIGDELLGIRGRYIFEQIRDFSVSGSTRVCGKLLFFLSFVPCRTRQVSVILGHGKPGVSDTRQDTSSYQELSKVSFGGQAGYCRASTTVRST